MGRERQKKKNRSALQKVKQKPGGRTKSGKKKVNFMGNAIIAENWDRKLTLIQNYTKLGLSSRLNATTGGQEKKRSNHSQTEGAEIPASADSLSLPRSRKTNKLIPTEARVERDPTNGRILRIIDADSAARLKRSTLLNDPLADLSEEDDDKSETRAERRSNNVGVVPALEAQAELEAETLSRTKRPRQQSKREEEWIEKLAQKHGDDTAAMFRDAKLNPMQQSEGDLRRRLRKWKERNQIG